MAMNRIQFQPGLSMPAFLKEYATEAQCERALESASLAGRIPLPAVRGQGALGAAQRSPQGLPVQRLPPSGVVDRRHPVPGDQVASHHLVSGDLPNQPGQDRAVDTGLEAPSRRELPHGLVDPAQTDAGHGRAGAALRPWRQGSGR